MLSYGAFLQTRRKCAGQTASFGALSKWMVFARSTDYRTDGDKKEWRSPPSILNSQEYKVVPTHRSARQTGTVRLSLPTLSQQCRLQMPLIFSSSMTYQRHQQQVRKSHYSPRRRSLLSSPHPRNAECTFLHVYAMPRLTSAPNLAFVSGLVFGGIGTAWILYMYSSFYDPNNTARVSSSSSNSDGSSMALLQSIPIGFFKTAPMSLGKGVNEDWISTEKTSVPEALDGTAGPKSSGATKNASSSKGKNGAMRYMSPASFIADAAEKVIDSVVNISVETEVSKMFSKSVLVSSGSGFFIDDDGTILTNAHVVSEITDGSSRMIITTSDGVEHTGYLHSMDSLSDLAIIKLKRRDSSQTMNYKKVNFGSNHDLRPGDWVVAIGSPFGLQSTVTAGVISSLRRRASEIGTKENRVDFIQTDCVVHSGSSGGPLVNLNGEVIAINTTRAESEGISFAIRVDNALNVVQQLLRHGRVMRPYLGLKMVSLTPSVWSQLKEETPYHRGSFNTSNGLHNSTNGTISHPIPKLDSGVLITQILARSPAQEGGLLPGDVITHVNDVPVKTTFDVLKRFGFTVNESVSIRVRRTVSPPLDTSSASNQMRYEEKDIDLQVTPTELDVFLQQDLL